MLLNLKLIYFTKEVLSVVVGWGSRFLVITSLQLADLILPNLVSSSKFRAKPESAFLSLPDFGSA